jgi:hypothetical protein
MSAVWPTPDYQAGAISPASFGSTMQRNVPDVAADADPYTGYAVYIGGSWQIYGGTSCGAPLWAAFAARVNQVQAEGGRPAIGFLNPLIYQIAESPRYNVDFHDIADGSTNGYYPAVSGYDLATGWGSFDGAHLLQDLTGGPPVIPPPSHLAATAVSTSEIDLSWTNNAGNAATIRIWRQQPGASFVQIAEVPGSASTYADLGLLASTSYKYEVQVRTGGGNSAYSNAAGDTTFPPPPLTPSGLKARATSPTQVLLGWIESGTADGFHADYRIGSGPWIAVPASWSGGVRSGTVGNLQPRTNYSFRLRAFNRSGESGNSNTATATTPVMVRISSFSTSPNPVRGRHNITIRVVLTARPPAGGATVEFTSSNPGVIPTPGARTTTVQSMSLLEFVSAVKRRTSIALTATCGGVTRTQIVVVNP